MLETDIKLMLISIDIGYGIFIACTGNKIAREYLVLSRFYPCVFCDVSEKLLKRYKHKRR